MADRWQPVCDMRHLRLRAQMLANIRGFFTDRDVLEVETPLLCHATGTDPQLDFFSTAWHCPPHNPTLYLQTSPEFAMKRLLAAGSGSIYQIGKAFRNGESGRLHNPEFTLLEWYRVGYNLEQLMDEVAELLLMLLSAACGGLIVRKVCYQHLFHEITGLDPLIFNRQAYQRYTQAGGFIEADALCGEEHVLWLDFIFSHCVQPLMSKGLVYLVHGYPAIQSSLARIHPDDPRLAERFEVFVDGMELGNGYFELADPAEQEVRFEREIFHRRTRGLVAVEKDYRLLAALKAGLPDCSGVALGVDRLLMLAGGSRKIDDVLAFPLPHA